MNLCERGYIILLHPKSLYCHYHYKMLVIQTFNFCVMFKTDFKIILVNVIVSDEGCFLNGDEIS